MKYKLKLKQLDFVSLVDDPAQPNAKCLLIKRKGGKVDVSATARLVKTSDELGLAFFWAFTSTNPDGTEHYDLHGDAVQADNDMIKAAAEFMEQGGAVDEMHDSSQTGRVVFAMPMTPEIAKAFGVETKTSGLMVAIRPSADAMAKLKSGEYRAVSIAGLGERIALSKGKVVKSALYTDEVDGHQHKLCVYEDGSMYCESATAAGASSWHQHGIVFEGGTLTILADSGHTHVLADGQPGVVVVPEDSIVVEMSAQGSPSANDANASKSTQATTTSKVNTMMIVLSEAQHAHYLKLSAAEQEAFAAKSSAERDADVTKAAAADPVVHKTASGIEIRKSHGDVALLLAKQADEQAAQLAKATEIAKAEASAREAVELKKRATDMLSSLAGADDAHVALLKAAEGIEDEKLRTAAIETLKAANDAMKSRSSAPGVNPGSDPQIENPQAEYDGLVVKAMAEHKVSRYQAADLVLATKRGAQLYAAINKRA